MRTSIALDARIEAESCRRIAARAFATVAAIAGTVLEASGRKEASEDKWAVDQNKVDTRAVVAQSGKRRFIKRNDGSNSGCEAIDVRYYMPHDRLR